MVEDVLVPIQVTAYGPQVLEFQIGVNTESASAAEFEFDIHTDGLLSQVSIQDQAYIVEQRERYPVKPS